jgi:hypothetical protein
MEDTISHTSCDSAVEEFVLINVEPKLQIAGNGGFHELERKLTEVLSDDAAASNSCCNSKNKMSEVKQCPNVSGDVGNNSKNSNADQQTSVLSASEDTSISALKMSETAISCKNVNTHAAKGYGGL